MMLGNHPARSNHFETPCSDGGELLVELLMMIQKVTLCDLSRCGAEEEEEEDRSPGKKRDHCRLDTGGVPNLDPLYLKLSLVGATEIQKTAYQDLSRSNQRTVKAPASRLHYSATIGKRVLDPHLLVYLKTKVPDCAQYTSLQSRGCYGGEKHDTEGPLFHLKVVSGRRTDDEDWRWAGLGGADRSRIQSCCWLMAPEACLRMNSLANMTLSY